MNREDLSRPPSDASLLQKVVETVLGEYPGGSVLSMSILLRHIRKQCPETISNEDIVREVVSEIQRRGLALQFDRTP